MVEIILNFPKNINQRGRHGNAVLNRKAQSFSLSWLVVRVLSNNDHLHLVKWTEVESIENFTPWRITSGGGILLLDEIDKLSEIRLLEFRSNMFVPRRINIYIHSVWEIRDKGILY